MTALLKNWFHPALTAVVAVLTLAVIPAQDAGVPPAIIQKAEQLRGAIEARQRIGGVLAAEDARLTITRIVKGYRRAASAWRLDPAVVAALSDQQISDYVLFSAQRILACTLSLWSRVSLQEGLDNQPDAVKQLLSEMTLSAASKSINIGPDCVKLINQAGEPLVIRNVEDLVQVLAFEQAFDKQVTPRLLNAGIASNATYRANEDYFTTQFAASLAEDRGFAQGLRRANIDIGDGARVYRFSTANLSLYLSSDKQGRSRLIFLAPFSW